MVFDSWAEFEQKMLRAKLGFSDADCAVLLDAAWLERCRAAALAAGRAAGAAGDGDSNKAKRLLELALRLGPTLEGAAEDAAELLALDSEDEVVQGIEKRLLV